MQLFISDLPLAFVGNSCNLNAESLSASDLVTDRQFKFISLRVVCFIVEKYIQGKLIAFYAGKHI